MDRAYSPSSHHFDVLYRISKIHIGESKEATALKWKFENLICLSSRTDFTHKLKFHKSNQKKQNIEKNHLFVLSDLLQSANGERRKRVAVNKTTINTSKFRRFQLRVLICSLFASWNFWSRQLAFQSPRLQFHTFKCDNLFLAQSILNSHKIYVPFVNELFSVFIAPAAPHVSPALLY